MSGRTGDRSSLDRLLGGPGAAWLVERVRARITAAPEEQLTGVVRLQHPTADQRAAAVRLVGRARRDGAGLSVDLAVVEEVLRRGPWPAGLADAVVTLTGPVVDTQGERGREAAAWERARSGLSAVTARFPELGPWWENWCASGGLKRAARAEAGRTGTEVGPAVAAALVDEVARVVEALPAAGEPLAVFARRVLGDAHGLDESRPLGRLAVAVVAAACGDGQPAPGVAGRVLSARDVWASAGVVLSHVASTALCVGVPGEVQDEALRGPQAAATAVALEAMRAARMPLVLTLGQVRSGGVSTLPAGGVVHVCENPTVVEVVAARWTLQGADRDASPVLVCTAGQPSTAVVELLETLTRAGAGCRYHGDFDWAGLQIARGLHQRIAWTPWRYEAADYLAAIERAPLSRVLTGSPAESPWDPALAAALAEHGLAVEEEALADVLADDLLRPGRGAEAAL